MDERLKHRLVGALVLVVAAVIFVPMLFGPDSTGENPVAPGRLVDEPAPRASDAIAPAAPAVARPATTEPRLSDNIAPRDVVSAPAGQMPGEAVAKDVDTEPAEKSPASGYAVQLASFSDARNATELRDRLSAKGYSAFTTGGSGTFTRVYVGPIKDSAEAKKVLQALRDETKLQGLVVRYPKKGDQ